MEEVPQQIKNIGPKLVDAYVAGQVAREILLYAEDQVKDRAELRRKGIGFMKDLLRLADDAACRYKLSHDMIARAIWEQEKGGKRWERVKEK